MVIIAKNVWLNKLKDQKKSNSYFFVDLQKRSIAKRQSFYQLLKELKQGRSQQSDIDEYDNGGRVYYDVKNGIYF